MQVSLETKSFDPVDYVRKTRLIIFVTHGMTPRNPQANKSNTNQPLVVDPLHILVRRFVEANVLVEEY